MVDDPGVIEDLLKKTKTDLKLGFETAAFAAFALFTLTIVRPVNIGAAIAGTALLIVSRLAHTWGTRAPLRVQGVGLAIVAFLLVLGFAAGPGGPTVTLTSAVIAPLVVGVAVLSWKGNLDIGALRWLGTGLLVGIVMIIGVVWVVMEPAPEIDVLELHGSGAEAVVAGQNPYTEARAPDTSPIADPGAEVIGYPYPPLTLVAYGGSAILFGDARWASVIAIALAVVLMTRPWAPSARGVAAALLILGLVVVVQPQLGHVITNAWTEPIALPLLIGAGLLWRRNPAMAAVLLGLTFGLKQYWIVALPLLLFWDDDFRWKRFWLAGGVAALSLAPAFALNPAGAWNAMVVNLIEIPPRPDSIGFAGIGWDTPLWLVLALSGAVAFWMGRLGGPAPRFLLGLAATLSTALLFGSQAFVNYWFFVATLALLALAIAQSMEADDHVPISRVDIGRMDRNGKEPA